MASYENTRRQFLEMVGASLGMMALSPLRPVPAYSATNAGAGTVMTVLGPIPAGELGVTLMHEHIYTDFTGYYEETKPLFAKIDKEMYFAVDPLKPVEIEDLAYLNMGGFALSKDAWSMQNHALMLRELQAFKKTGGNAVLEVSPWGKFQGPDFHTTLKRLSEESGIHIVCSTGLYGGDSLFWYDEALAMSEAELVKTFIGHARDGFGDSGVKAGHLKTAPNEWGENEHRAARACIATQKESGLLYTIHHGAKMDQAMAEKIHTDLIAWGGQPERTVLAHIQKYLVNYDLKTLVKTPESRIAADVDFYKRMLDHGFILSFDTFSTNMGMEIFEFLLDDGTPNAFEGANGDNDAEMLAMIYYLIQEGYAKQIVISQDCYSKVHLRSFGGHGYTRVTSFALPLLRNVGVSEEILSQLVVGNPARLLQPV